VVVDLHESERGNVHKAVYNSDSLFNHSDLNNVTDDKISEFVMAAKMKLPKMLHKVQEASSLGGANCSIPHSPSNLMFHEIHHDCMLCAFSKDLSLL
jgi:hypothetical protein